MPSELLAALCGAIVAFGGTYLLQRAQFRRKDLEELRLRHGIARALRADLAESGMILDTVIKRGSFARGTRFPSAVWESHGHLLIAAVVEPMEFALMEAFGRLRSTNGLLQALPGPAIEADSEMELPKFKKEIDIAMGYLNTICDEYKMRERNATRKPWQLRTNEKVDEKAESKTRPPIDGPLIRD